MQRSAWGVANRNTPWRLEVCQLVAPWGAVPWHPQGLQRGAQRRACLCDPPHQHVLHCTPTQGSWLKQVELWFSVLARRFLKRGDYAAVHDFDTPLTDYLEVYNTHHAHPYRWTYTGQPLGRATPVSQTRRQQRQGRAGFRPRPKPFERACYPPRPYKRSPASLVANLCNGHLDLLARVRRTRPRQMTRPTQPPPDPEAPRDSAIRGDASRV